MQHHRDGMQYTYKARLETVKRSAIRLHTVPAEIQHVSITLIPFQ